MSVLDQLDQFRNTVIKGIENEPAGKLAVKSYMTGLISGLCCELSDDEKMKEMQKITEIFWEIQNG